MEGRRSISFVVLFAEYVFGFQFHSQIANGKRKSPELYSGGYANFCNFRYFSLDLFKISPTSTLTSVQGLSEIQNRYSLQFPTPQYIKFQDNPTCFFKLSVTGLLI